MAGDNLTHCTRACPAAEHLHHVEGDFVRIRYTLDRQICRRHDNHWHRVERVAKANAFQRIQPQLRKGSLG